MVFQSLRTWPALAHRFPYALSRRLFGDRKRYGLLPVEDDPSWVRWQEEQHGIYRNLQSSREGKAANHAGYRILQSVPLAGKRVMEIGPGEVEHSVYWTGTPEYYQMVDKNVGYLQESRKRLEARGIATMATTLPEKPPIRLPAPDASIDVVLSFYSLEHLYPLAPYLDEIQRVLKPGGVLAGAIPTEGGLAWGVGRYLMTRPRYERLGIDIEKVICWEHRNFVDSIMQALEERFRCRRFRSWPIALPLADANLVFSFIYEQK